MIDPANLDVDSFAFFGYPSKPEMSRESLAKTAELVRTSGALRGVTWEDLDISGRLIIDRITTAIDRAAVSVFDVTSLNANVMFEVGYAIGADRQIWLVRKTNDEDAERQFREVGLLGNVGYESYENSRELSTAFLRDRPDERAATFFQESIVPSLDPATEPSIFYVSSPFRTEAEREIERSVDRQKRAGIKKTISDPRESSVESLTWYAYHCYSASAVIVHLLRPGIRGAEVHNARCALVAGLAHGMRRPVLMLVEEGYQPPIDYRELLFVYKGGKDCGDRLRPWLTRSLETAYAEVAAQAAEAEKRSLSTELAGLRLGEPIAENEADRLASYFVPTSYFEEVMAPRSAVFVGRRGAGKTANMIKAANDLEDDRRNLVCRIQPSDYDLDGLVRVLGGHLTKDAKGYVVESLWKYLLISEIAFAALDAAHAHPAPLTPGEPAWALENYTREAGAAMSRDFAVRLERAIASVEAIPSGSDLEVERGHISEALHATVIHELLEVLTPVLRERRRVAVLIDNLDQSWEHAAEVESLAQLLLGLLTTARGVGDELSRRLRGETLVTLAVFVRADIFARVSGVAKEPDKIPATYLNWDSRELLLEVVEERYIANRAGPASDLWRRYFDPTTRSQATREYMASRVLPRPRDILYLVNFAIEIAVRQRHGKVTAEDVLQAERLYSQFAFEALLVEGDGHGPDFECLLFELIGEDEVIELSDMRSALSRGGVGADDAQDAVISDLVALSFLGQEVHKDEFEFAESPRDRRRIDGLARRLASSGGTQPRFKIHPAYHAYLDISAATSVNQRKLPLTRD